jgi:hypothetical protein
VEAAMATGASDDDIVDVLAAVAPIVGLARLSTRGTPARPRPRPRLDADATQPRWRPERTKHGWTTRGPEGETSRTEAMRDGSVISASV